MTKLYKLRRWAGKSWEYMATETKWNKVGRLYKEDQLTKILNAILVVDGELPSSWEVVEYQLVQSKTLPTNKFLQYKKQSFVPKDIL